MARATAANPGVEAARERWLAAQARAPQASALPDPRLTWRVFLEPVETRVGPQRQAIGVAQTLPWPGVRSRRNDAAEAEAERARADYEARLARVVRDVRLAWLDAWDLERSIEIVRRNADLVRTHEEIVRRRYSAGESEFGELMRIQVELGSLADRLAGLEDRRRPVAARMNALLDRASDAPLPAAELDPSAPLIGGVIGGVIGEAALLDLVRRGPELSALRAEAKRREHAVELAKLSSRPDLTFGLEWIETDRARAPGVADSGQDPLVASLSFTLPVQREAIRAREREARALRRASVLAVDEAARRLEADAQDLLYRMRDAERRVRLYTDELLPRARQSLEAQEAAFRGGKASFLELLDAEHTLLDFELELSRARADQARAVARLEGLAGRSLTRPSSTEEER